VVDVQAVNIKQTIFHSCFDATLNSGMFLLVSDEPCQSVYSKVESEHDDEPHKCRNPTPQNSKEYSLLFYYNKHVENLADKIPGSKTDKYLPSNTRMYLGLQSEH